MQPLYPLDPADARPDLSLWSGWPEKKTHLTTFREPTPAPVDMVECVCGEHVWIAADDRRWTWGNPPELHHCPTILTPLESAEEAWDERGSYWDAYNRGDAYKFQHDEASGQVTDHPKERFSRDAHGPDITDLVIE